MKRGLSIVFWIACPIVFIMLFASLLTSNPYMRLSKGLYPSHEQIYFDHGYVSRQLIDYLNYRHDDLYFGSDEEDSEPVMTQIGIDHMVDVKEVYTQLRVTALIALILVVSIGFFMFKKDKQWFYETIKNSFWIPLGFIVFVGTWFAIDFGRIFTWFHEIFFDGGWQLPAIPHPDGSGRMINDPLILLLPEAFWLVSGVIVVLGLIGSYLIMVYSNYRWVRPLVIKDTNKPDLEYKSKI